jgi:hypothetical protein
MESLSELEQLKHDVNELKLEMSKIHDDLKEILLETKKIRESCTKMDCHIGFVENVYDKLRYPLDFLKNKVEYITGKSTTIELHDNDVSE